MSITTSVCVYLHLNVPLCRSAVSPSLGFTALANIPAASYRACMVPSSAAPLCLPAAHPLRARAREPSTHDDQKQQQIACLLSCSSAWLSPARSSTVLPLRLSTYARPVRESTTVVKTTRRPLTAAAHLPEFPPAHIIDMGFPVPASDNTRRGVPLTTRNKKLGPLLLAPSHLTPNTPRPLIPANAFPYLRF